MSTLVLIAINIRSPTYLGSSFFLSTTMQRIDERYSKFWSIHYGAYNLSEIKINMSSGMVEEVWVRNSVSRLFLCCFFVCCFNFFGCFFHVCCFNFFNDAKGLRPMPMGQSGGPLGGGGGPGGGGFPDGPGGGPGGLSLDGGDEDGDGPGPHRRRKTDKTDKPEKGQGRKQVKDAKTPAKGQSRKEVKDAKTTTKDGKTKDGKKKDAKKTDAMHKKVVKARKVETKAPIKAPMKAKGK